MNKEKKQDLVRNAIRKAMKVEMLLELIVSTLELEYNEDLTIAKVMEELYKVRSEADRLTGNDPLENKEEVVKMDLTDKP